MKHLLLLTVLVAVLSSTKHQTLSCRANGRNFSDMKPVLVQSLKKKLLRELGLSSVPNITRWRVLNVPPYFRHLVEARNKKFEQRAKIKDDFHAKIKQIFLFPSPVVPVTNGHGKHYLFKSKPSHTQLEIKSATLWAHIRDKNSQFSESAQVKNYELHFFGEYLAGLVDSRTSRQKPFLSKQFNYTGWHALKMTDMIRKWFSQHGLHLGLNIQIVGNDSLELGGPRNVDGPLQPFMVVDTDEVAGRNRKKRAVDLHWCPSPSTTTCCLHDVEIKFHDIGWDFVMVPNILNINACSGNCDSLAYYKNPGRARALKGSYTSCCVPRNMASITMLYYDNDLKLTYKKVPNMIANSCQCIV